MHTLAAPSLASLVLVAACASSEPAAPPAPVEARVSGVLPRTTGLTSSTMDVKIELYNPRSEPVEVESIAYRLDTGEVAGALSGAVPVGATLEGEQQAKLGFDMEIPLPGDRLKVLAQEEVVPADLSGEVKLGDGSTASFSRKTGLAVPNLPKFVVADAQAAQYQDGGVEVTFFLRLVNENPFTMPVEVVEYEVEVAGETLRADQAGLGSRLTAGAAEEYEVNIALEESKVEGLADILASGVINYRITGAVTTSPVKVPFEREGVIDMGASGE